MTSYQKVIRLHNSTNLDTSASRKGVAFERKTELIDGPSLSFLARDKVSTKGERRNSLDITHHREWCLNFSAVGSGSKPSGNKGSNLLMTVTGTVIYA
jgi:hypothetical protein